MIGTRSPLWQRAVVGSLVYLAWLLHQPVYRPPIIGGDGVVYQ